MCYFLPAGNDGGYFKIGSANGLVETTDTLLNHDTTTSVTLTLTASDGATSDTASLVVTVDNSKLLLHMRSNVDIVALICNSVHCNCMRMKPKLPCQYICRFQHK